MPPHQAILASVLILGFVEFASAFRASRQPQVELQKLQQARDAINQGDVEKLRVLLVDEALDPNSRLATGCGQNDSSLVHVAAEAGQVKCLQELILHGAVLNNFNSCREAPIHRAAEQYDGESALKVVTLLANKGSQLDLDAPNADGLTAMHIAAAHGNVDVMRVLADMGCRVDSKDKDQLTPLHYAAAAGETEVVNLLLSRGVNVNAREGSGATAAHYAAKANRHDTLKQLIDAGIDVQAEDSRQKSIAVYATRGGALDCLQFLHERGANLNAADKKGRTPLHFATMKSALPCLRFLLEKGAEVNAADIENETPVHYAVRQAHLECLEELVEAGGSVDLVNKFGETVEDIAWETEDDDVMDFLNISSLEEKVHANLGF